MLADFLNYCQDSWQQLITFPLLWFSGYLYARSIYRRKLSDMADEYHKARWEAHTYRKMMEKRNEVDPTEAYAKMYGVELPQEDDRAPCKDFE